MILAGFHSTFTIPLIASLTEKVSGFSDTTYSAVTGLAYDATNKKLGLKVGADTVIPFSGGIAIKSMFFTPHYKNNKDIIYSFKSDGTVAHAESSNNDWQNFITNTIPECTDLISSIVVTAADVGTATFTKSGYYMYGFVGAEGYENLTPSYIEAGDTRSLYGLTSRFIMIYLGETNPFA